MTLESHVVDWNRPSKKIFKEMRVCPFCPNSIEDELHFILQCPTYSILHDKMLTSLREINPLLTSYSRQKKFKYIILFITNCFNLRASLISQNRGDGVMIKSKGYTRFGVVF